MPSAGTMLTQADNYLSSGEIWLVLAPGIAIVMSVLGFNLIGDGLREALDPKLRGRVGRFRTKGTEPIDQVLVPETGESV